MMREMPSQPRSVAAALDAAVVEHAMWGVRLQLALRAVLAVFLVLTVVLVPPVQGAAWCAALVVAYAVWSLGAAAWAWRGGPEVVRRAWLGLFVDLVALSVVTLVAGVAAEESWTADLLVNGFFLLPVLAATQLRPGVCAAVSGPATLAYLASSLATRAANEEPGAAIAVRTLLLAGLGAACVGLSWVQRSRVATISALVGQRSGLLDELVHVEARERRELSERLHDGALQYVLAARHDLEEVGAGADAEAVARVDHALAESSRLLRSTLAELHPAVLERIGLARALEGLAQAEARPGRAVHVDTGRWPGGARTSVDPLLYGAARELLSNVAKHSGATSVEVRLARDGDVARLTVADDGVGVAPEALAQRLEDGHIGLHTLSLRVQAVGGSLHLAPGIPKGTVATVEVPVPGPEVDGQGGDDAP